ncbi:MAG: sulfotransferase family protein [Ignavibacteria bacterium]
MPRFHFISGLPRSGSTLLSAILRQNPRFHASVTSPVAALFTAILNQVSAGTEWAAQVGTEQRRRLLRGLFDSYYADLAGKDVIFDTNRIWTARLPALLDLFPQAKIIACVRNVAWVMDSIERLYRKNPYENTGLFANDGERSTVFTRCETLAQRNRLVGLAYSALKEAYYSQEGRAMLVVDYDLLVQRPQHVLPLIYQFLGEAPFEHDFANLEFDTPAYDEGLGLAGLHKIRPKVGLEPRETILPPELFEQYAKLSFWGDVTSSRTNVLMVKPQG